jgi:hypothetical protein
MYPANPFQTYLLGGQKSVSDSAFGPITASGVPVDTGTSITTTLETFLVRGTEAARSAHATINALLSSSARGAVTTSTIQGAIPAGGSLGLGLEERNFSCRFGLEKVLRSLDGMLTKMASISCAGGRDGEGSEDLGDGEELHDDVFMFYGSAVWSTV